MLKQRKIHQIIFDCDGVLVDSEILANRVEAEVKTEMGFPITLEEQIKKFVGMGKDHPILQDELKKFPPSYWQAIDERIKSVYEAELKTIAGTVEALENLDLPKCVASNSEPEWLEYKLSLTGLKKYFGEAIFHGKLVKRSKPAPDLFLFALEKMGWSATDCLVIEDSVPGVKAGKAAGLTVCGFLGGAHILEGHAELLREAGADFLISDLRALDISNWNLTKLPLN